MRVEVDLEDITWICDDCGNRYGYDVPNCPNNLLNSILFFEKMKNKKPKRNKKLEKMLQTKSPWEE